MATPTAEEEQRARFQTRLQAHFQVASSAHSSRWDSLWQDGSFLPWDRGAPAPALVDLLAQRRDLVGTARGLFGRQESLNGTATAGGKERRTALVPGCGRGYDCYLLQAQGWHVTGLDVSAAAVAQAKALAGQIDGQDDFAVGEDGKGTLDFEAGDFFALGDEWMGRWDLIWDYTFLCALPLELRPRWARQMSRLLSPSGRLVCLEFPTTKDPKAGGPPWPLPSPTYIALLSRPGDDVKYGEDGLVLPEEQQNPRNEHALDRVAHFIPERTFAAGQGSDWISVWKKAIKS